MTLPWFHAVGTLCTNESITSRELDIVQQGSTKRLRKRRHKNEEYTNWKKTTTSSKNKRLSIQHSERRAGITE